ncbi:hypothetical protein ACJ73_05567 [Blastomyces percursus]|uniref:Uncharacterized protein n=1 Tax=Blastomyces percursus TaxID=1658174 RepID=A0A1J9Q3I5_9EURO|nr:hypothetical protein ACJ73_05567 [Blastomyces percursus]
MSAQPTDFQAKLTSSEDWEDWDRAFRHKVKLPKLEEEVFHAAKLLERRDFPEEEPLPPAPPVLVTVAAATPSTERTTRSSSVATATAVTDPITVELANKNAVATYDLARKH